MAIVIGPLPFRNARATAALPAFVPGREGRRRTAPAQWEEGDTVLQNLRELLE